MSRWVVVVTRDAPDHVVWQKVRELSDEEYATYQTAARRLTRYSRTHPYAAVADAYRRYRERYDWLASTFASLPSGKVLNYEEAGNEISQQVFAFLAAMRRFLDHTETYLKRNNQEDVYRSFKEVCSREFDEHFSYRFAYKLRNFEQHIEGAIRLHTSTQWKDDSQTEAVMALSLQFDRDRLLANFADWGKHVRPDLERMPLYFEVDPILRDTMGSLDRIAHAVIKADLPGMIEAARSINDMVGEARLQPGTIAIVDGPLPSRETVIQPGADCDFTYEQIPLPMVDRLLRRQSSATS
jgi:hypothetical protein